MTQRVLIFFFPFTAGEHAKSSHTVSLFFFYFLFLQLENKGQPRTHDAKSSNMIFHFSFSFSFSLFFTAGEQRAAQDPRCRGLPAPKRSVFLVRPPSTRSYSSTGQGHIHIWLTASSVIYIMTCHFFFPFSLLLRIVFSVFLVRPPSTRSYSKTGPGHIHIWPITCSFLLNGLSLCFFFFVFSFSYVL